MQTIAQSILICLCFLMFKVEREKKLAILFFSTICFDCVRITFIPFGYAKYILCISFLLSEIPHIKSHIKSIKGTILSSLMFSMIIATIILAISSPHYNNMTQYIRITIMELVAKNFIICYAFLSIKEIGGLNKSFKVSFYGLIILTGFGVLNYITKNAIFIDEMLKGMTLTDVMEDAGSKFTYSDRFRVQAMFPNPFNYGYICILLLLFNWFGYSNKLISKRHFYISIICCLFGIITCGCRTNMLCAIIGIIIYILFAFNYKKKFKYILFGLLYSCLLISFIPALQDKLSETITVFDKNSSNVTGSSIEMRIIQYTAVLYHIRDHEWLGRGLDFFNIDLGWGEGQQFLVDKDLAGLEGVLMNYLLERGIIGVIFYLFFYSLLFSFVYRNKGINKSTKALCLSVLSVYLAFANMTGELNSVFPSLLIVGVCIKLIYINREKDRIIKRLRYE